MYVRVQYKLKNLIIRPSIVLSQKSALYVRMQCILTKINIVHLSTLYLLYQRYTLSVVHLHAKHYTTEYNVSVKSA